MNCLIVDDHAIVRRGLREVLEDQDDLKFSFHEAGSCSDALACLARETFHLVLLDIAMPGRNGLEVLSVIHQHTPNLPVLIISMYPETQYATRALKLGAAGYLTKDAAPDELLVAVRKVLAGGKYVSGTLSEILATDLSSGRGLDALHTSLSNRELHVACQIASGHRAQDIAQRLNLSIKTVGTYRARLLKKLMVKNTAELTAYCIKHALIQHEAM